MREANWDHDGGFRKLAAMLSQFASNEVPGLAVSLDIKSASEGVLTFEGVTDADGYVHFDVGAGPGTAAQHDPAWEVAQLRWTNRHGPQSVEAFILAPGDDHRLAVISDIDDTIIETGADDLRRNWRRVLAQMPGDREAVPGAAKFYGQLSGSSVGDALPATRRPFFYVSSSPWNLFDYLVAFQKVHGLPEGPILLRDWDLSRATFGHGAHQTHKARAIAALIDFYPDMRFALIGDNTQADALAYAEAVRSHPERIAAVFIRQAPGADLSMDEEEAIAAIRAAGVELWTGASYDVGSEFLASVGFTQNGETTQIVKTIEEAGAASPAPIGGATLAGEAPVDSTPPPA